MPRSRIRPALPSATTRPFDLAADALAGERTKASWLGQGQPALLCRGDDGGGQRMLAGALDRSGSCQQIALRPLARRHHRDHARPAFGQRAGLVENERIDALQTLQRLGRADQHAGARALADPDHDRHRRRQAESAGAGDDEHRYGGDQRVGEGRGRSPDRPGGECHQRDGDHRGHEPAGHDVGEPLDRRTRALRFRDHGHDAGKHGLGPHAVGAEDEGAGAVDRAADHAVAGPLGHRHRLAGHHRFVDGAAALLDNAIDRHAVARPHAEQIARMDPIERDLLIVATGGDAARRPRGEVEQRTDGAPGALARPEFEHLAQQHEDRDHRGGLEIHRDARRRRHGSRPGTDRARSWRPRCRPRPRRSRGRSA